MEIKHNIKLSSGKTIELTEQEYQEMVDEFKTKIDFVPYPIYPQWPAYPQWPYPTWYSHTDKTGIIDGQITTPLVDPEPEYSKTVDKHFWKLA